jgi:hypothetical protein
MEPNLGNESPPIAAADLYMTARHRFTFEEVAVRAGIDVETLRTRYNTKADLLRSYYSEAWWRYVDMETSVPDFNHYSLAEKLTTMVFSLCDEFDLVQGFSLETYDTLLSQRKTKQELTDQIRERIRLYMSADENISMLIKHVPGDVATTSLTWTVRYLIDERVHDRSADKERTSALTDKVTTLSQSVLYTGTIDHLIDLARYLGITYYSKK